MTNRGRVRASNRLSIVEGASRPWHSLAPSLGAEGQDPWTSWQQAYSAVDSRSMAIRNTRIKYY